MHSRQFGAERELGIGGGMVSAESQKNLEIAEELCRKEKPNQAVPYLMKAMEDSNNMDAFIQCAFLCPTLDESVECLEAGIKKGRAALKRRFGSDVFDDGSKYAGHFWDFVESRPYMRILQAMVRIAFTNKNYKRSAEAAIEMLRLCPGDNLGQRTWLGSLLLRENRVSDALSFVQAWLSPAADKGELIPHGGTDFKEPSSEPLSASREEKLSDFTQGALVYNAAIASFKLFGNCPLSSQYLRIAAKLNPIILVKILAKLKPPSDLNMNARPMNGSEDAQDYLWLTQDLWMEPAVWNWASEDSEIKSSVRRMCCREGCDKVETKVAEFKRCAACKMVWYCTVPCQKQDWRTHKPKCLEQKSIKKTSKAFTKGRSLPSDHPLIGAADFMGGKAFTHIPE